MTGEPQDIADADPHVVRKSADETGGEFVRFESTMYPASAEGPSDTDLAHEPWGLDNDFEHVHTEQEERLAVVSGELRVVLPGEERTLTEGETVEIPRNTPHRHFNPTDRPTRLTWERRPALRTEEWAETVYAIAQAGETDEDGVPGPLQAAVILDEYAAENPYFASVPVGLQRVLASAVAPIGRLAGVEASRSRERPGPDR